MYLMLLLLSVVAFCVAFCVASACLLFWVLLLCCFSVCSFVVASCCYLGARCVVLSPSTYPSGPTAIAVHPHLDEVYVVWDYRVLALDSVTGEVLRTIGRHYMPEQI